MIANGVFAKKVFGTPDSTDCPPTVRLKSSGKAFPPSLLVGSLIIVSFGPKSSFVIVQVMSSPSSRVIVPPNTAGHFASPDIETKL